MTGAYQVTHYGRVHGMPSGFYLRGGGIFTLFHFGL